MLELKNVNKYFNKGKRNQIHVINNTSLTIGDNGLVALLGPSGCGKTTLLNCIGGLDKIKKGKIYINGKKISSLFSSRIDKIRNLNIGYIFQDYKLIDDLSVYDNVALVLIMIGIKDKKEIKKRVEYVLDKVGMLRYRKRPAGMLSGGERQRVGIARAIVKDPNIILADEITGNLDSKNSLEIMKIIKAISKDRLVILVTHEQNLAKFYATRVIEIKDGKIVNDYDNEHQDDLDYEIDNSFYLKDFSNAENLKDNNNNIKIYSNDDIKLKLDIVVANGNIYIQSNTKDKVEIVDDTSSIEFIDDHYKKIAKEDINKYNFDFKNIINKNIKERYSSIFNPITLVANGFRKVFDYSFLKKALLIGFFISGIFIMNSVSTVGAALNVKEENFVTKNKQYLEIENKKNNVNDYLSYESAEGVNYILPGDSIVNFKVNLNDFYQTSQLSSSLKGSLSSINMLEESDLIKGRMPANDYEIVVDRLTLKNFLDQDTSKMVGLTTMDDMINRKVSISNMNEFIIVGVVDKKSPSIYTSPNVFINILANSNDSNNDIDIYGYKSSPSIETSTIFDYTLFEGKIELKSGRMPTNDYETIVNISNKESMPLNKQISTKVNDNKLTVVGYYYSRDDYQYYFVNNNTIKYDVITKKANITIYSTDKAKVIEEFRNLNLNISDTYKASKEKYVESRSENVKNTLLVSGIALLISLVEIFLMIRASFLSRIKEIGIYRAIGVKKMDIYKMFFGEIFAITTLASIPGLLISAYIFKILSGIKYIQNLYLITPTIVIISVVFIYVFNLLIGLIPVFNTIKKTPAQILARHDLD